MEASSVVGSVLAVYVSVSPAMPTWWLWLACLALIALIPTAGWIARDARRVRVVIALCVAVVLGSGLAVAAYPPPGWEDCCPAFLVYMICWPVWLGCG